VKSIPFIDLELSEFSPNFRKQKINRTKAKQLVDAAKEFGFVQLVGHGIQTSELIDLMTLTSDFFSDIEMTSSCQINNNYRGFIREGSMRMRYSKHPDKKESFIFGLEDSENNKTIVKNNWPEKNPILKINSLKMLKKV